ncbi:MAG: ATP-binding protein, partial [Chloroflexota bacterium]|nr:ATP-binding protein [Chloroflexota bacterium]
RVAAGETVVIDDVERVATVPGGPWGEPVRHALAMPIASSGQTAPLGVLVAGVSPNRALDEGYRSFYELLAGQVSVAIRNAGAFEEVRERAATLAELDRAKTAFFSNVSHEFRTPITLLLGPIEEGLADAELPLPPPHRERLLVAHRNALRLLKLVNALLDFSRVEAGRLDATFAPTDLARLTADVASTFRSAVEQAGLRLVVDCPPLPTPVAVDRDLWETIVLNLLSNAFKHTFVGEIAVSLRPAGDRVELEVRDTGVGIPPEELPRLFDRFHRVPNARARTHEGAGIGLALVQELARRHGGDVRVESVLGRGTGFFVTVPVGDGVILGDGAEARAERGDAGTVSARASAAAAFAEEALRWLPDGDPLDPDERSSPHEGDVRASVPTPDSPVPAPAARILLADDNADMRHYVARLLRRRYEVEAVADGATALAAARARPPDLVLADVMMPNLDGYGLLRALRADPRTSAVPVVLLSARAGEEARIEGLEAGADDYLLKPFSARELLARVGTRIELTRLRADLARSERERAANQAAVEARDRFLSIAAHELRTPITAVKTAAHLLDRAHSRADANPEREARFVRRIGEAADRLAALTDDLLDVSRVHLDRFPLRRAPVDLLVLVREAVERCQETLPSGHPIAVEAPQGSLPVVADAGRLEQVLTNLLENAAKYSPAGSEIRVTVGDDGDGALISVRDRGIGLSPGADEVIFAPFGRAPDAGRSGLPGLGMGLYISRAIVERHGGRLWAESAGQGRGTTFHVRLPKEGVPATVLGESAEGDNGTEPRDR